MPKKRSRSQSFSVVIVKSPTTPTILTNNPHTRRRRRRRTSLTTLPSSSYTQKCTRNAPILIPVDINDPSIRGYPALLHDKTTHAVSFTKGDRSVPSVSSLSDKRTKNKRKKRKKRRTRRKKNKRKRENNDSTPLHEYIKSFSMSD